jgi:hypothetical protein
MEGTEVARSLSVGPSISPVLPLYTWLRAALEECNGHGTSIRHACVHTLRSEEQRRGGCSPTGWVRGRAKGRTGSIERVEGLVERGD